MTSRKFSARISLAQDKRKQMDLNTLDVYIKREVCCGKILIR